MALFPRKKKATKKKVVPKFGKKVAGGAKKAVKSRRQRLKDAAKRY